MPCFKGIKYFNFICIYYQLSFSSFMLICSVLTNFPLKLMWPQFSPWFFSQSSKTSLLTLVRCPHDSALTHHPPSFPDLLPYRAGKRRAADSSFFLLNCEGSASPSRYPADLSCLWVMTQHEPRRFAAQEYHSQQVFLQGTGCMRAF